VRKGPLLQGLSRSGDSSNIKRKKGQSLAEKQEDLRETGEGGIIIDAVQAAPALPDEKRGLRTEEPVPEFLEWGGTSTLSV